MTEECGPPLIYMTCVIAPQAQLFETGKDRRVKTKALFKGGLVSLCQLNTLDPPSRVLPTSNPDYSLLTR